MTQVESAPAATGNGGPKKQFASRLQTPSPPPQSASEVQAPCPSVPGLPVEQCRPGPGPFEQSERPDPLLPASVSLRPLIPETSSAVFEPSVRGAGGSVRFPPAPIWRQPSPRSRSLVPVVPSISPENGATLQLFVPGLVVNLIRPSGRRGTIGEQKAGRVVVVLVDVVVEVDVNVVAVDVGVVAVDVVVFGSAGHATRAGAFIALNTPSRSRVTEPPSKRAQ